MNKSCKTCIFASNSFTPRDATTPFDYDCECIECSFWESIFQADSLCGEFTKKVTNKDELMFWEI